MKTSDPEAVLFTTADGTAYEFIRELNPGLHGERMLLARPRLKDSPGAQVVIKTLGPTDDAQARKRLEEEIHLASLLEHPGITRVLGLHEVEGALYAVLEYMEGRPLEEVYTDALLCGSFCSERFVLYVAAELASALHAAHTLTDARGQPLGIVHRDIHPERICLGTQGEVKLGGFGLATSHLEGRLVSSTPRLAGPVVYVAPEQLLQRPVDARSDLFSLGLVMMELLTGQHLYRLLEDVDLRGMGQDLAALTSQTLKMMEITVEELARLHELARQHEGLAPLAQRAASFGPGDVERLAREVPEPTRAILHKLLRQEPEERYRSAAELETALRERLQSLGPYGAEEASEEAFLLQAEAAGLTWGEDAEPGHEGDLFPRTEEDITTQPS